jgi:hypothetical protein
MSITLYLEPILDPFTKEYTNVITVDRYPEVGALRDLVKQQRIPELSEFKASKSTKCKNIVTAPGDRNCNLVKEDIPFLLTYLQKNGYTIETELTKLYKHENLICIVGEPTVPL